MTEQLSLRLGSSRVLVLVLSGAHVLAAVGLWLAPMPLPWGIIGSLGLAGHLVLVLRRDAWRTGAGSTVGLELWPNGSVRACSPAGLWSDYRIAGSSFASSFLAVVNLRPAGRGRGRTVLIARDDLDADDFRRLCVWLRWRYGRKTRDGVIQGPEPVSAMGRSQGSQRRR